MHKTIGGSCDVHARLLAKLMSLHSLGSIHILRLPQFSTLAASRFCSFRLIPMAAAAQRGWPQCPFVGTRRPEGANTCPEEPASINFPARSTLPRAKVIHTSYAARLDGSRKSRAHSLFVDAGSPASFARVSFPSHLMLAVSDARCSART